MIKNLIKNLICVMYPGYMNAHIWSVHYTVVS